MWLEGDVVIRREVLNDEQAWLEVPVVVVRDDAELLATYLASGAPFRFPDGPWPTPNGLHPWHGKERWRGHGVLMLQRPEEMHAVWVFWQGEQREFAGWYVNFQDAFRRTDTSDLELDIWIPRDGVWQWKDEEFLETRVHEGRVTPAQVDVVRAEGQRVAAELDAGRHWWDDAWASWQPDPAWPTPEFQ